MIPEENRAALDRLFHDQMYGAQEGDFLTLRFTNFVTIRRTYEDIREYILPCRRILDLGCGGGYDLLYMAQQHPEKEFWGFDHSPRAIVRAREQARHLGLRNVSFQVADILDLGPDVSGDIVVLKDAFHHVVDPTRLVEELEKRTSRVVLIEPSGFSYPLDYDDLLYRLREIYQLVDSWVPGVGEAGAVSARGMCTSGSPCGDVSGETEGVPLENRYLPDQIESFFRGWKIQVKGTVSIFSIWEPWFQGTDAGSELMNQTALALYRLIDERLRASGVDLEAKHLVIYASREDERDRQFDGFARLESGKRVAADWRRRRLEQEYPGWQVTHDLIEALPAAVQHPGEPRFIESGHLRVGDSRRGFLFEHPDSSVEYSLWLPAKAEFRGFLGINPAAWSERGGNGVLFRVDVMTAGERRNLFSSLVDPWRNPADRRWHRCIVPLGEFSGQRVTLILSTEAPRGVRDFCWSGWGDPVIVSTEPSDG